MKNEYSVNHSIILYCAVRTILGATITVQWITPVRFCHYCKCHFNLVSCSPFNRPLSVCFVLKGTSSWQTLASVRSPYTMEVLLTPSVEPLSTCGWQCTHVCLIAWYTHYSQIINTCCHFPCLKSTIQYCPGNVIEHFLLFVLFISLNVQGSRDPDQVGSQQSSGLVEPRCPHVRHDDRIGEFGSTVHFNILHNAS